MRPSTYSYSVIPRSLGTALASTRAVVRCSDEMSVCLLNEWRRAAADSRPNVKFFEPAAAKFSRRHGCGIDGAAFRNGRASRDGNGERGRRPAARNVARKIDGPGSCPRPNGGESRPTETDAKKKSPGRVSVAARIRNKNRRPRGTERGVMMQRLCHNATFPECFYTWNET